MGRFDKFGVKEKALIKEALGNRLAELEAHDDNMKTYQNEIYSATMFNATHRAINSCKKMLGELS